MIELYARMIARGLMELPAVPEPYRRAVANALGQGGGKPGGDAYD